jgi:hypothetical protein
MELLTIEIDADGYGRFRFELPSNATVEEIAYIQSLELRMESGMLELIDPTTDDVVFSCRPYLVH